MREITRALLCDLDDSLVHRSVAFRSWAIAFAQAHGQGPELVDWMVTEDCQGHRPRTELFEAITTRLSLRESPRELQLRYQGELITHIIPDEQVLSALRDAKSEGWKIAVVTNYSGATFQLDKIRAAGIDSLLDAICISGVEGVAKPDPRLFHLAIERCKCLPGSAWMIGDHPRDDIGGAIAARLSSVWLSLGRTWPFTDYFPTFEAASFPEAVRHILNQ